MITGRTISGQKCVYDLPAQIKTAEEFESLIYGFNNGRLAESQREELYNQPKLLTDRCITEHFRGPAKRSLLSDMKNLANFKPKRSALERQPRDGLPALMMADQKGKI